LFFLIFKKILISAQSAGNKGSVRRCPEPILKNHLIKDLAANGQATVRII